MQFLLMCIHEGELQIGGQVLLIVQRDRLSGPKARLESRTGVLLELSGALLSYDRAVNKERPLAGV